ncbi:(deoxy)nucleoside triphosphate pyrophosphohydrolase [Halobacillus salinus]|uniref:(deoxy)nucleoside triphosphate pyrophosphohydrolase n=1 Tax=Halobacillus salinus TaxID=192814 RepID=UPI0009A7B04F|nr:(deoxy)nucleoside triphosphate pyrophosphohydrolase [Halobacillus salinus]
MKKITVVAAILENEQEEVLCALRSNEMSLPNMWEFPGGKVEEGEDIRTALEREIQEELSCQVKTGTIFHDHTHEYESFAVRLIALKVDLVHGVPTAKEHAKLLWMPKDYLLSLQWAPADLPAVERLMVAPS